MASSAALEARKISKCIGSKFDRHPSPEHEDSACNGLADGEILPVVTRRASGCYRCRNVCYTVLLHGYRPAIGAGGIGLFALILAGFGIFFAPGRTQIHERAIICRNSFPE